MNKDKKNRIGIRYAIATVGLMLVAVGVAFSINSNLGTAPISCPPYVLSLWGGLSVGEWTVCMHLFFLAIQLVLLRKKFEARYLHQLVASLLFGVLTDVSIWAFSSFIPHNLAGKFGLALLSLVVTALGISLEVASDAWMLAGEMTTLAISTVLRKPFPRVKVAFDVVLVLAASIGSFFLFHNLFGCGAYTGLMDSLLARTEGVVIGIGTILSAFLTGTFMHLTDPLAVKIVRLCTRTGREAA